MSTVCRSCLAVIGSDSPFFNLNIELDSCAMDIKSKLEMCVPELTVDVVKDPVICSECLKALRVAYKFKKKCMETEEKIYEYILEANAGEDRVDICLALKWLYENNAKASSAQNDPLEEHKFFLELTQTDGGPEEVTSTAQGCSRLQSTATTAVVLNIESEDENAEIACNTPVPPEIAEQWVEFEINDHLQSLCIVGDESASEVLEGVSCEEYPSHLGALPECSVAMIRLSEEEIEKWTTVTNEVRSRLESKTNSKEIYKNKTFKCSTSLKLHQRKKNGKQHRKNQLKVKVRKNVYPKYENMLLSHMQMRNKHSNFGTTNRDVLQKHIIKNKVKPHINAYDYKCIEFGCKYRSSYRVALRTHYINRHYKTRPFVCAQCNLIASTRHDIINHALSHTVVKMDILLEHSYAHFRYM